MGFVGRHFVIAVIATMVAFGFVGAGNAGAAGQADQTYGQAGRWITDQSGRVVTMHGFNLVNKLPALGYGPACFGIGGDYAGFL